ncbi:MAG: hypothetical protein KC912_02685 [Proteobacteria bacterium]|nr:hypothetical protein [Pseudomonadota bacterium]
MTWLLLLALPSFAQDADAVIDCDGTWFVDNFNDLNSDDDCDSYASNPCGQPISATSPDHIFQFTSNQNVWVQVELGYGSRLAMNYYTAVDEPCGDVITCVSGQWQASNWITWFSADANRDYFLSFDSQGQSTGAPDYHAEISGIECCFDDDGDGFFNPDDGCDRMPVASQDCDDADINNFPGNPEVCDGSDNDCDGQIDENASATYYLDDDGDGYGLDSTAVTDCGAPTGYAEVGGDCDDANVQVNPGATEICNAIDDDCDGNTDEGFDSDGNGIPDCADNEICDGVDNDGDGLVDDDDPDLDLNSAPTWYLDTDGDGHADSNNSVRACTQPSNGLATATDCDDAHATRFPGNPETCDGIDNNCNVTVDEGTECYDDDGDGFTESGGDCNDSQTSFNPTATEFCNGNDEDCDGTVDEGTECYDDDGDGFCEGPACADGTTPGDCNDGLSTVSPGITEQDGNGIDDDCDGTVDSQASDPDGDGVLESAGDCAPDDASTFPGAPEVPDAVDNDCDGTTDEGTTAGDDDGDGSCEGANLDNTGGLDCGDGSTAGDCNDTTDQVSLNGTEVENEIDDDCDGVVDEGTASADDDLDGFSDEAGDCDDSERAIYPGAEELEDGIDNDCDGTVDEGFADRDGDGVSETDGDCDDDNGWVTPGRNELCDDGIDNDCDEDIDEGCDGFVPTPTDNCGCSSTAPTGTWVWLPFLALLRRRKRAA